MSMLPTIACLSCGIEVTSDEYQPRANGGAPNATGFESCLRRCSRCGIGYSNALHNRAADLVRIYRDPFADVPSFIADGHEYVLVHAMNVVNRTSKKRKFASINSEDHVTWTVFRAMQLWGELPLIGRLAGLPVSPSANPVLLYWGTDLNSAADVVSPHRELLTRVMDDLGEDPQSRSEPDVIIDFGEAGVVFVEVKLRSGNDFKPPDYRGWPRYSSSKCFNADVDLVSACGAYELARNWRLLDDYAGDRPGVLVNLANDHGNLEKFENVICSGEQRRFLKCSWDDVIGQIAHRPLWLRNYLVDRQVCSKELLQ